jgi:hypothetical protein
VNKITTKTVCYHEAGHAVMAWRKGIVYSISVISGVGFRGFVKCKGPGFMDDDEIRILLAGYTACAIGTKSSYFYCMMNGGMSDFRKAEKLADEFSKLQSNRVSPNEIMKRAEYDTRHWINTLWPAVQALTEVLYLKGGLNGKDAKRIIRKALGNPPGTRDLLRTYRLILKGKQP